MSAFAGCIEPLKPFCSVLGKLTLHKKIKHGRVLRRRNLPTDASGQSPGSLRTAGPTAARRQSR